MTDARPISRQQTIKSIAIVAARKGITVRSANGEIVITNGRESYAFASPEKAAAFLLLCGAL